MNKIIFLLAVSLITFISLQGQNWVSQDAVWHYDYYITGAGFYKINIEKDTLIQNKVCQEFQIKKYEFWPQPGGVYTQGDVVNYNSEYTYSSGDTVFWFNNNKFFVLFNFNANIGDEWVISDMGVCGTIYDSLSRVKVIDTNSMSINGQIRKVIKLESINRSYVGIDGWIVDGVGPIDNYLFPTGRNTDSTMIDFEQHDFKCFQNSEFGLYNPSGTDCEYLLNHVGINEAENVSLSIYPNPTNNNIWIEQGGIGKIQISLYDNLGRTVLIKNSNEIRTKLDLEYLPQGVYIIKIFTGDKTIIKKIIKR